MIHGAEGRKVGEEVQKEFGRKGKRKEEENRDERESMKKEGRREEGQKGL